MDTFLKVKLDQHRVKTGETLSGKIYLSVSDKIACNQLSMKLIGVEIVNIT